MLIDLTTAVSKDNPLKKRLNTLDNPHIAAGHIGTHLDSYKKSSIPLEYFKSRAVLFDVRGIGEVSEKDIDLDKVKKDDFVCFRTGRIESCSYGEDKYFEEHPQLSDSLIRKLIEKQIRFIGIDSPGIRRHKEHTAADRYCEQHRVYVIENLSSLNKLPSQPFTIYTMWLDDEELTGLKCRVIAEL